MFCFTLHVFPITQTSKRPKKIIRVNENLCCRNFFVVGGVGCVCVCVCEGEEGGGGGGGGRVGGLWGGGGGGGGGG